MSTPENEPQTPANREPGERPPGSGPGTRRRLDRPPSERYGEPATSGTSPAQRGRAGKTSRATMLAGSVLAPVVVALGGAAMLTVILGGLTTTAGTFAVSGIASVTIGLLAARAAIAQPRMSADGGSSGAGKPLLDRDQAARLAIGIAIGMIVLTGFALWLLARFEGGVLDPITYVWTTFGFGLPAQAIVAVIGAAWGAANGPIRWRQ